MIRRTTLVALLLAATACGGDDGEKDKTVDSGSSNDAGGGGGGGTNDGGGGSTDAGGGADAAAAPKPDQVTNAGTTCTNNAACEGESATCLKSVDVIVQSITFPGGYCSFACKDDIECGDGECPVGESLGALGAGGGGFGIDIGALIPSHCYKPCDADTDCRTGEGYRCATILEALATGAGAGGQLGLISGLLSGPIKDSKYCLPPPPPAPEGGTPDSGTPDSGTPDSGTPDSGADAGAPDADTSDV